MSPKFDPALIKKLSSMYLRARYVAEGAVSGLHQSSYRGASLEFAHHRQYSPGDELRYLDWKIFGRTDRYFVKQFHEETNLRCYHFIDSSASMGYGSGDVTKSEYASYLAGALTYLLFRQRDAVGLLTYSDRVNQFIPPRSQEAHMHLIFQHLEKIELSGESDIIASMAAAGRRIRKRSVVIFYSDFMEDPDTIVRVLKYFHYMKNDVIVFHILDPEEINLTHSGQVEYEDMETGDRLITVPDVVRKEYSRRMKTHIRKIGTGLRAHRIDHFLADISQSPDNFLTGFLERRRIITG